MNDVLPGSTLQSGLTKARQQDGEYGAADGSSRSGTRAPGRPQTLTPRAAARVTAPPAPVTRLQQDYCSYIETAFLDLRPGICGLRLRKPGLGKLS
jgi:hypothetical protein